MGLRNGESYLRALKDNRKIYYEGKLVEDVTREEGFRNGASAVAQFYDFQNDEAFRDVMTHETEDGERAGTAFILPRSKDDLRKRAAAYALWADVTCGFLGRSPDYMNTLLASFGGYDPILTGIEERRGGSPKDIYLKARRGDFCFTHTFVEPFKVAPPPKTGDSAAGAVERPTIEMRETDEGLYFKGARGLATLAPFADMNIDLVTLPLAKKGGEPYIWSFVCPINAPGIQWICRDVIGGEADHFSAPLSGRSDEIDCLALYDNLFIPWENVLFFAPIRVMWPRMKLLMSGLSHQTLIRSIAKTRFMIGLAHLLAESSRVNQFINIQERIGEMVGFLRTLESFSMAAIEGAIHNPTTGLWYPHPESLIMAGTLWGQFNSTMVNHLLDIGGGRYMSTPQEATIDALGEAIEDYVRGAGESGRQNVALHRLAWDVAGSSFGMRQDLYERFHQSHASQRRTFDYISFDKTDAVAMVKRILDVPPTDKERFPVPPQKQ